MQIMVQRQMVGEMEHMFIGRVEPAGLIQGEIQFFAGSHAYGVGAQLQGFAVLHATGDRMPMAFLHPPAYAFVRLVAFGVAI